MMPNMFYPDKAHSKSGTRINPPENRALLHRGLCPERQQSRTTARDTPYRPWLKDAGLRQFSPLS